MPKKEAVKTGKKVSPIGRIVKKPKSIKKEDQNYLKSKGSAASDDMDSGVLCVECDAPISAARLKIIHTDTCVACMEQFELQDKMQKIRSVSPELRGTKRHQMEFEVQGTEEVEEINLHIRRGG